MQTIKKEENLSSFLEKIDNWNLFDEVVEEFTPYGIDIRDFYCSGGEVKEGTDRLFRWLVIDREHNDIYRFSFNSKWCPADQKKWLWQVIAKQHIDSIVMAKSLQQKRFSEAWGNLCRMLG